jgi:hypothetical protein
LGGRLDVNGGFRVCIGAVLLAGGLALACKSPSDVVYERPGFTPKLDEQGRLRVTFAPGADVLRGFTPNGRLLFRAENLVPFGAGWILASVPPEGGQVREEVGVYRPAFRDQVSTLVASVTRRELMLWKPPMSGARGCPDSSETTEGTPGPAPATPSPVGLVIFSLPTEDGASITSIPSRAISTGAVAVETVPGGNILARVRVTPALRDVARTGANPFGPIAIPGTDDIIYSDGERLWQASATDTGAAPAPLGEGAYPALSPDGTAFAYARPVGLDSTVQTFTIPVGLVQCVQTQVEITAASWEVVLRDVDSGDEQVLTEGVEPAFDPLAQRLVVRGSDLQWFDLSTLTAVSISGTTGAFAPAVSPDGTVLAFSLFSSGTNSDVYYLRISR